MPKKFTVLEHDHSGPEEVIGSFDTIEQASTHAQNLNDIQGAGYLYTVVENEYTE